MTAPPPLSRQACRASSNADCLKPRTRDRGGRVGQASPTLTSDDGTALSLPTWDDLRRAAAAVRDHPLPEAFK